MPNIISFQFETLCQTFSVALCSALDGQNIMIPAPGFETLGIERVASVSEQQIKAFCIQNNVSLPDDYALFLRTVGIINLISENDGYVFSIHGISPIGYVEQTKSVFDDFGENPFPDFLLTHITSSGDFAGLVLDEARCYRHFGICHAEIPPEYWAQDYDNSYACFSEWFVAQLQEMRNI